MRRVRASSVNEMIASFVRAEIDSPRFQDCVRGVLQREGGTRTIVDAPNLAKVAENRVRHRILADCRGYSSRFLFQRFPDDVAWSFVGLDTASEVGDLRFANYKTWLELSGGTRLVSDGLANLPTSAASEAGTSVADNVAGIERRLRAGEQLPELILVGERLQMPLVLLEGHTRAVAYCRLGSSVIPKINAIVGVSRRMNRWWLY